MSEFYTIEQSSVSSIGHPNEVGVSILQVLARPRIKGMEANSDIHDDMVVSPILLSVAEPEPVLIDLFVDSNPFAIEETFSTPVDMYSPPDYAIAGVVTDVVEGVQDPLDFMVQIPGISTEKLMGDLLEP